MAKFVAAYDRMIRLEGGYRLHDVPGDRGGQTYAGIARARNPQWRGWPMIDRGITSGDEIVGAVKEFYRAEFWAAIHGDSIDSQEIADAIFDFAVNAGIGVAARLAQVVIGADPDGRIGPVTVAALNTWDPDTFVARYALAKVARYAQICNRDRGQVKFLLGWVNRTLEGIA